MVPLVCLATLFFILNVNYNNALADTRDPGMKVKVSSQGLLRISNITRTIAYKMLPNLALPSVKGDKEKSIGTLHYEAWNIKINTVPNLDYALSPAPNGSLMVTVKDVSLTASGQWRYNLRGFIPFSDSGHFDVVASRLSMTIRFVIGIDSRGVITMGVGQCDGAFGMMAINVHNWVYNWFKGDIEREVNKPCEVMREAVLKKVDELLQRLNPRIAIGHDIIFDARLLSKPKIDVSGIDFAFKGEFFHQGDSREAPFRPNPLPAERKPSRPFALEVTEYVFNTLSYVMHTYEMQGGNITRDDLPTSLSDLLNTSCSKIVCIGFLIPQLGYLYPNSFVEIDCNASDYAVLRFTKSGATSFANILHSFRARLPDGRLVDLFSMSTNISLDADLWMEKSSSVIHWKINRLHLEASLVESHIGWFPDRAGILALEGILRLIAIPKIDKEGSIGRKLPLPKDFELSDARICFEDGYAVIEGDVDYRV